MFRRAVKNYSFFDSKEDILRNEKAALANVSQLLRGLLDDMYKNNESMSEQIAYNSVLSLVERRYNEIDSEIENIKD